MVFKNKAQEYGWDIVMYEVVHYGVREWKPLLSKLKRRKPALLFVEILNPPDVATLLLQYRLQPTKTLINLGHSVIPPESLAILEKKTDGVIGYNMGIPKLDPPNIESYRWLKQYFLKYNSSPASGTYAMYNGVKMWSEAVKAVGNHRDYDAINQYIAKMEFKTLNGHVWQFDRDRKIPLKEDRFVKFVQAQQGKLVTLYSAPGRQYKNNRFMVPHWIKM